MWKRRMTGDGAVKSVGPAANGQLELVEGVLLSREPSTRYPSNWIYEIEQVDGSRVRVAGTFAINGVLGEEDIGRRIRLQFVGWARAKSGRQVKQIDVAVN